jgi:hypothetical protein
MAKASAARRVQDSLGQTIGMAQAGAERAICARLPLVLRGRPI